MGGSVCEKKSAAVCDRKTRKTFDRKICICKQYIFRLPESDARFRSCSKTRMRELIPSALKDARKINRLGFYEK
jgi:hypothetical protein